MTVEEALKARAKAASLIREFEGLRLIPYRDQAGLLTVGIGHRTNSTEPITYSEALRLFALDLDEAFAALDGLPLNVNQTAACASFVFNVGRGAFAKSTMRRMIERRDYDRAAAEFDKWVFVTVDGKKVESRGLKLRREAEKALFQCVRDL